MFLTLQLEEDISDIKYLRYHNEFEKREIKYYGKIFKKYDKRQSIRQQKNFILEAKKSYENLYNLTENIIKEKENDFVIIINS